MAVDYKKEYKEFYMPKNKPGIIEIPKMNYIAVRGKGNPNEENGEYKNSIGLLYGIAFTIKMSYKGTHKIEGFFEYVVPPLEGLWWQENTKGLDYARKEDNLEIIRKILGLPKSCVDDALELVGLTEFRKRLAKKYSLGMKQRLGLAGALIGRPPILILDEPTNGLDPVGIHEIRTLIRSLPQKYDCTVLVSSHLLPEVELMADDIGILNHGHLLFEGTKEELKTSARAAGFPTDNLEDTFLAMIDEDNRRRGGTV